MGDLGLNPFFSIIVPIFNLENYIEECYKSIFRQNFPDYEILFIDDGSTDSSGALCDRIAQNAENVNVIHKANGGLSDARNVGIREAKGKYVIFVDSDDMLHEEALEKLYSLIVTDIYPDVVINRIKILLDSDMSIRECNYTFPETLKQMSIAESFQHIIKQDDYVPGAWTIVAKRKYLIKNDLFFVKGLLHEDEQWTPRAILKSHSMAFNNSFLYLYRQGRIGSITQVRNVKREMDKLWIIENLYSESTNAQYSRSCRIALIERASDLYWGVLVRSYQYALKYEDYNALIRKLRSLQHIFAASKNRNYILCNLLIKLFGMRNISAILYQLAMKRKSG